MAAGLDAGPDRSGAPVTAAILVTVVLWASAFVGIRSAARYLSPGALAFGRLGVASLALGAIMLVRREKLPPARLLPGIVVCGVLWFGLYNVLLNEAERRVDAGTAAMLVNIAPILIAVLAGVFLHEGVTRRLLGGCLVAFSGVVVIGLATSKHGLSLSWGATLCVLAALCYAGALVVQKPLLAHASALQITFSACVVGAITCVPFAPALASQLPHAPASAVAWLVYLGVAPMAVGFLTWAYALARSPASRLGTSTYLVPPIAILLGWLVLGEAPPPLAYVGGALCLLGVWISRRVPVTPRVIAPSATSA
jgi:drug/metabolite transporter (DMT)-like permease